ncbi:hypothetical protein FisN_19Lh006 [Fistulifera solaris]|uniref:3'-5' exonuclease n=1 Tax=Fistulifera solaris TaxID=1519565 RepID=A0A388S837_FISSO|nr:hypothetical protein FisN_19Lh006 [Fistulifera solaris]|eukprot:GBO90611.1 hypothetical protein FisN_19Lh006 [Fistulifera solaris]
MELEKAKRKEQASVDATSAVMHSFLGIKVPEKAAPVEEEVCEDVDMTGEELEKQFTERLVIDDTRGQPGDVDVDDDDDDALGFEEDGDYNEDSNELNDGGIMSNYLSKIQTRLRDETRCNFKKGDEKIPDDQKWLLKMLEEHQFSLPWQLASTLCNKLGINWAPSAYYCTVHVWLTDVQFNEMPPCGECKSNAHVGRHAFDSSYPGRRISGLKKDEYVMTMRYCCSRCKSGEKSYTFRGYNLKSLESMPLSRKICFPALLTHKSGVTMELARLIRSLVSKNVRSNSLAAMIAEMHQLEHKQQMLLYESEVAASRFYRTDDNKAPLFSDFNDRKGYNGRLITGKYIQSIYQRLIHSFRELADADTKKRDSEMIKIDASYKFTKRLKRVGGEKVFDGLVTVMNEFKEIRSHFVIFGESHDQMRPPLQAMKATMDSNGQAGPKLAFTDSPKRDADMLISVFDSLAVTQEAYNTIAEEENKQLGDKSEPTELLKSAWQRLLRPSLPICSIVHHNYSVIEADKDITMFAGTAMDLMKDRQAEKRIMALDLEWPVHFNNNGRIEGQGKVATIQLSYHTCQGNLDNDICTTVIRVQQTTTKLNATLVRLLSEDSIRFVGVNVAGDVTKLKKDFANMNNVSVNKIDLRVMARRRGVVPRNGSYSLVALVEAQLKESMEKDQRMSDWSGPLQPKQLDYAALDAIKSLQVYDSLDKLPDLTRELQRKEILAGTKVTIVASKGSKASIPTPGAEGEILSQKQIWTAPKTFTFVEGRSKPGGQFVLVRIKKVLAPGLIMDGYRKGRKGVSLGDFVKTFADDDFVMMVNLSQLRSQHQQQSSSSSSDAINPNPVIHTTELNKVNASIVNADNETATTTGFAEDDLFTHDYIFEHENEEDISPDPDSTDAFDDFSELTPAKIREIDDIIRRAVDKMGPLTAQDGEKYLDPPPKSIPICYSAVLGDIIHAIMRIKVPAKHECRKAYSAALVRAFLEWDPERLKEVKEALVKLGISEKEIEARLYYNIQWFAARVERRALPPHLLYWRVCAVLSYFGNKIDSVSKKPLFGKNEWNKAKSLLSDIRKGYFSDPPGVSFYRYRVDGRGQIIRDRKGFALLTCTRGTNDVENEHRNLLGPIGNSPVGLEMMDCLLTDIRLRRNMISARKYRLNFPDIRHFDPWLVDELQITRPRNVLVSSVFPDQS